MEISSLPKLEAAPLPFGQIDGTPPYLLRACLFVGFALAALRLSVRLRASAACIRISPRRLRLRTSVPASAILAATRKMKVVVRCLGFTLAALRITVRMQASAA